MPIARRTMLHAAGLRRVSGRVGRLSRTDALLHHRVLRVLGHWDELLPFWQDRTDSLSRTAGLDRKVSDYVRSNVFITNSGMSNPALLHHALEATTIDHLLFGTDYPFQRPTRDELQRFLLEFDIDEDRSKFTAGNARLLFGIDQSSTSTTRRCRCGVCRRRPALSTRMRSG